MSPRDEYIIQTTSGLVNTVQGRINGVVRIRVGSEGFGVDVLVGEGSTNDEGVSNDVPLSFGAE